MILWKIRVKDRNDPEWITLYATSKDAAITQGYCYDYSLEPVCTGELKDARARHLLMVSYNRSLWNPGDENIKLYGG